MHLSRSVADRQVAAGQSLRQALSSTNSTELRRAMLLWLDRKGPFIEDDRQPEVDDYFEYNGLDVTDSGLGEAARRIKANTASLTFSFPDGSTDFAKPKLKVDHGLAEDRIGTYVVGNIWNLEDLADSASNARTPPINWEQLVSTAREQCPQLNIPDAIYSNPALSKEPFDASISDRALILMKYLNDYMVGRTCDGAEGPSAREVVENFFTGDRALFSGESAGNQDTFRAQMTFPDPDDADKNIFAHWHGKISHRFFRLHFEWPVPAKEKHMKILYLGPKITKK